MSVLSILSTSRNFHLFLDKYPPLDGEFEELIVSSADSTNALRDRRQSTTADIDPCADVKGRKLSKILWYRRNQDWK